ncbi:hypothetical protein Q3G72_000350 [Acer saccharum]|nr:hypothetical protein Q3G72_000350 [Acer saccharum]
MYFLAATPLLIQAMDSRSPSKMQRIAVAALVTDSSPIRRPSLAYPQVKMNWQVCDFLCNDYGRAKTKSIKRQNIRRFRFLLRHPNQCKLNRRVDLLIKYIGAKTIRGQSLLQRCGGFAAIALVTDSSPIRRPSLAYPQVKLNWQAMDFRSPSKIRRIAAATTLVTDSSPIRRPSLAYP